jgi:hypothetical protein
LILIDALFSEKKRERKKEMAREFYFPGLDPLCWLCHAGFSRLLGLIKG